MSKVNLWTIVSNKDFWTKVVDNAAKQYGVSREDYLQSAWTQLLGYVIYRRAGAPRWQAWATAGIQSSLWLLIRQRAKAEEKPATNGNQGMDDLLSALFPSPKPGPSPRGTFFGD